MDFQNNPQSILTFRVGPVLCCAPSLPVISIITPPKLTHPPGSNSAQPGIFRHGSHIVKVIDLRQKFGIDKAEITEPGHLIITVFGKDSYAFWVDQIIDVFDFPGEGWGSIPPAIPRGIFSRTLLIQKKIHLYAEFIHLTRLRDMGYLKHYIQQLKQSEQNSTVTSAGRSQPEPSGNAQSINNLTAAASPVNINASHPGTLTNTSSNTRTTDNTINSASSNSVKAKQEFSTVAGDSHSIATPDSTTPSEIRIQPTRTELATARIPAPINSTTLQSKKVVTPITKPATQNSRITNTATTLTASSVSIAAAGAITKQHLNNNNSITAKVKPSDEIRTAAVKPVLSTLRDDENASSLFGILFLFLFLLLLILAGISTFVYRLLAPEITESREPDIATTTRIESNPAIIAQTVETPLYQSDKNDLATARTASDSGMHENNKDIQTHTAPAQVYRAEISREENEITITIHQTDSINKESVVLSPAETNGRLSVTEKEISETTLKIEQSINEIKPSAHTIEKNLSAQTVPENHHTEALIKNETGDKRSKEKKVNEVIHIVVKGDTLWAIAKKYVNNPYLYPELARLSQIKNPDRIYPGNRVRIRFVKD